MGVAFGNAYLMPQLRSSDMLLAFYRKPIYAFLTGRCDQLTFAITERHGAKIARLDVFEIPLPDKRLERLPYLFPAPALDGVAVHRKPVKHEANCPSPIFTACRP